MKAIRKGNDIEIRWSIFMKEGRNNIPYILNGRELTLYLDSPNSPLAKVEDFKVSGNVLTWVFKGKEQKKSGIYKLTLVENEGEDGMRTVDKCKAFSIVNCSCNIGGDDDDNLSIATLELSSSLEIGVPSSEGEHIDLSSYVSIFPQSFSDEQKEQARENIGAVSVDYVISVFEEIKALIQAGNTQGAVAVLDNAILDLTVLG